MNCITFNDLIKKYKVKKIDLLHIDTEGYDYEILKTLDFKIKPNMILFEHKNLGKNKRKAWKLLRNKGYKLFKVAGDTLAY